MKLIGIARAHTNIALIKYWGKRNKELFLPMNSSLSLTLDAFYTDTKVTFDDALTEDSFLLNGEAQAVEETNKIAKFLDLFRQQMPEYYYAKVESLNFVPTAAGLASSASAFAALAGACNLASGLNLPIDELSTYARRGSGSSTRSLFGGFVEWDMGSDSDASSSRAHFIDDASWDIGMVIIVVNNQKKTVSSRLGMEQTVATSPFYPAWVETAKTDLAQMKQAIQAKDFKTLGEITETNGMKMHATMLGANPPICYFEPESILAQQQVRQLRELGIPAYMTMDAGPNVKVLCRASDMPRIKGELSKVFDESRLITSLPGEGVISLSEADWEASKNEFFGK
ncbi:diphosphomevalonate decarboxylase [Granulicatella balaenopterae]|uniref:diphosphomevalonate decarboxylase n=1 Tax=Granulicatella balaenopterae TaxID=137733 RepID=A0A1H9JR64_9LACT|nr:diphosphomevalonate decarboxylase [Granulicatella balaenopterae]SEQ89327.1 diphosphomevalonate decarboxylase [Granulicatella balaenopterae]